MIRIPKSEYARRRKALMAQMEPNSIAILPAAPMYIRNRDVEHVYRQDSDFQYLTGFPEPEAVMALIPGRAHGEYVLFCRERDPSVNCGTACAPARTVRSASTAPTTPFPSAISTTSCPA